MGFALHLDAAMMRFHDPGADGEPQPGALFRMGPGVVCPVEAVEDALLILTGNADALIGDDELCLTALGNQRNVDRPAGT